MRKIILFLIPILIFSIFVFVMTGGEYFKKPLGEEDNVMKYTETLKKDVKESEWEQAENNFMKLETAWDKVIPRVQFTIEMEQANRIKISLARLKGHIEARDKSGALAEINELVMYWEEL